jgi:hypothetical protein
MEIPDNIKEIIGKLYDNKLLGPDELAKIELWLVQNHSLPENETWLKANWEGSINVPADLSFDEIRRRIRENDEKLKKPK